MSKSSKIVTLNSGDSVISISILYFSSSTFGLPCIATAICSSVRLPALFWILKLHYITNVRVRNRWTEWLDLFTYDIVIFSFAVGDTWFTQFNVEVLVLFIFFAINDVDHDGLAELSK